MNLLINSLKSVTDEVVEAEKRTLEVKEEQGKDTYTCPRDGVELKDCHDLDCIFAYCKLDEFKKNIPKAKRTSDDVRNELEFSVWNAVFGNLKEDLFCAARKECKKRIENLCPADRALLNEDYEEEWVTDYIAQECEDRGEPC